VLFSRYLYFEFKPRLFCIFYVFSLFLLGQYLDEIVVGDIDHIDQPQCHKCTKKQKKYYKKERRKTPVTLW